HVVLLLNGILAYFIPDLPRTVRDTIQHEKDTELERKLKEKKNFAKAMKKHKNDGINYFSDARKIIDYVLVVDKHATTLKGLNCLKNFIKYLQGLGVEVEINRGNIKENIYVCLHLPSKAIQHLSNIYGINIDNMGHNYIPMSSIDLKFTHTSLTKNMDIFKRQRQATSMERILIAEEILNVAKFGDGENEYGIHKLISINAVKTAYPLHDGHYNYDPDADNQSLNDRQLLHKYWANFSFWYKEQPLNIIEKYYGSEVAFYFAWLGFYNKMLIPAAIIALISSFISFVQLIAGHNERVFENVLKIRWNVEYVESQTKVRLQYKEKATHKRFSMVTGRLEPYTPVKEKTFYLTLSFGICLLFMVVVVFAVFGVIMYRITVAALIRSTTEGPLETFETFLLMSSSAILQVVLIKIFGKCYAPLSEWLTKLENPRTQVEFDNAVVYKRYFLGFVNNYASLFYIAFIKGRFYTPAHHSSLTGIETDICHPCGCLMSVCNQLFFLMVLKSFIGNILTIAVPLVPQLSLRNGSIETNFRKIKSKFKKPTEEVLQWEEEFRLEPAGRYLLTTEFMEMIIQYGFVTFFVAAFPLAPVFALVINCLELRVDALKLVTRYRRPIPKKQSGIGPWNGILQVITHLSVATNAFMLAFTSNFVAREIYKFQHDNSLVGYIESTLSLYDMKDAHSTTIATYNNSTLCYYKSLSYPPDHPEKYKLRPQYWYEVGMRLLCVIVFEHLIWVSNGMLSYFIPDVPQQVKQKLHHEQILERDLKLKVLNDGMLKTRRRKRPEGVIRRSGDEQTA
ncbi:Anoctamin domain containing protein, partial [Asbolus verrucosus]